MLFYRAALPLSRKTLTFVAGIIRRHRAAIGSCWRKLNPGQQALLVLAYLRKGETFADLAAGFGVGTTTAWPYVNETVALLAARAPELRQAIRGAKKAGFAYVVIDGTLIAIDRVAADRPFYSGKHRRHGMNLQVIAGPDGDIVWVSGALPGAVHDKKAEWIWGVLAELEAAGLVTLADKTQPEPVAAVLVHHDTDLCNLTIRSGTRTSVIHTTRSHLFWDGTTARWNRAATLRRGDHLRTPTGAAAVVVAGYAPLEDQGWMWDLTITVDHDFYIDTVVGVALVHNCDEMVGANGAQVTSQEVGRGEGWRVDVENPNPGVRPGQLHLQDYDGHKYQYNFQTGEFEGVPRSLAKKLMKDPMIRRAIARGLQYLGMG